jgi:acyl transferase domain-containing protein/3-hydroxymyristoyl/3-hydroxydecanoyl-(acyl carrier protein) dehydratase
VKSAFEPIAIVGMASRFPGCDADQDRFLQIIQESQDVSREVPADRWVLAPNQISDSNGNVDTIFHARGYFLQPFESPELNDFVGVESARILDPLFHLVFDLGHRAIAQINLDQIDRSRAGIIFGSIALPTDSISRDAITILRGEAESVHPWNRHVTGLPAELLAESLSFGRGGYTIDAACASTLYAFRLACNELQSHRVDLMIAGGVSRPDSLYNQMGFTQLQALSRSGRCSPFDQSGDGLMVGEGGGLFVLKRLRDAEQAGDLIHGVIRGIGLSNDREGSLVAPATEGQIRAMRQAYEMASLQPSEIDFIECHATGTPRGDLVEFQSLLELYRDHSLQGQRIPIGSVKANVGHLLTGANSAGLIKCLLAMKRGFLPPQPNYSSSPVGFDFENSPFVILQEPQPWNRRTDAIARKFAISGFGFGGIDAHMLVEEYLPSKVQSIESPRFSSDRQVSVLAASCRIGSAHSTEEVIQHLTAGQPFSYQSTLELALSAFRVPPRELEDALPQQQMLLQCLLDALNSSSASFEDPNLKIGVFVGVSLDPNTTNYHLRWNEIAEGLDSNLPPLNADRTLGALASIAASRIARYLKASGPSFTISRGARSGREVVLAASDSISSGEIDVAIVAAVDLLGDPRETPDPYQSEEVESSHDVCAILVLGKDTDQRRWSTINLQQQPPDSEVLQWESVLGGLGAGQDLVPLAICSRLYHAGLKFDQGKVSPLIRDVTDETYKINMAWCQIETVEAKDAHKPLTSAFSNEMLVNVNQPERSRPMGKLAFIYPGSGNHYPGMGREYATFFPEILQKQQVENRFLKSQYRPDMFWDRDSLSGVAARDLLFGQVTLATLVTDAVRSLGLEPDAVIGYSLGESASYFALRSWRDRDLMWQRLQNSTLFTSDLAPPYHAARRFLNLRSDEAFDWVTAVFTTSAERITAQISQFSLTRLLIINHATECVVGGERQSVIRLAASLNVIPLIIDGVTLAHCDLAQSVADAYFALHSLPVTPNPSVHFYSTAHGKILDLDSQTAAESITTAVLQTLDYHAIIEKAYSDGVRYFLEMGPGDSCTRLISEILKGRPHWVMSICNQKQGEMESLRAAIESLSQHGFDFDLSGSQPMINPDYITRSLPTHPAIPITMNSEPIPMVDPAMKMNALPQFDNSVWKSQQLTADAHAQFMVFSIETQRQMARLIAEQNELIASGTSGRLALPNFQTNSASRLEVPRSLSTEDCFLYATSTVESVFGTSFAEADHYPTRVRLPDGPLMLVDSVRTIEGKPKSMTSGRIVTDHFVHKDRWYLDSGVAPTCVSVEAGQADLMLSGFLGIDFETKGLSVYRLLDAVVVFHRGLPRIGEEIVYDIHIDHFFKQGETYLFRFHFEGTIDGQPFLSMRDGCAGFFSQEELDSGKGIVHTAFQTRPDPQSLPADWIEWVPVQECCLSDEQVDALREGNLTHAFGSAFQTAALINPILLPSGMLRLVDRVIQIQPKGGRYGLGFIRAEADIHPDDWFLTCHFIDDQVMPGTLMYECCLHTLRIFLMRLGWIGEEGSVVCEPMPGISSRLKCRGQVIASTKVVTYEVRIKQLGYAPDAFAIADALMYADGKPIVEITEMSLRMIGITKESLQSIWSQDSHDERKPPIFDTDRILAFAVGKPSEAFGEPYRIFDQDRIIARLPGPPYQFLDRITAIDARPWVMEPGGVIEAQYDVPEDAWFFEENRSNQMPFGVLLEVVLQPCGWLAAYVGSALTSPTDVSFRNLGGNAIQYLPVTKNTGTITTRVKLTKVSSSGGMIIQHYDYTASNHGKKLYEGDTYFGFFSKQALANQVGLTNPARHQLDFSIPLRNYPVDQRFPGSMLRMVDTIRFASQSGPNSFGIYEGTLQVDPELWFFKAHFFQDPVCPGSLGLESAMQLLRFAAIDRWNPSQVVDYQAVALNKRHSWSYRGQVVPSNHEVRVQVWPTNWDDDLKIVTADGLLFVDERPIYDMKDFSLQLITL